MKLIVGLGNPGKEYEHTRHNVGWLFLGELVAGEEWQHSKKANADYVKKEIAEKRVELLKPTTFMNNSGLAVAYAKKKHDLPLTDIIVIHDDKDIPLGETRVQKGRGAAGHNGVQSIIDHLGEKDFWRIRIGVAPADREIHDTAHFVLARFTSEEQKKLETVFKTVHEELIRLVADHA